MNVIDIVVLTATAVNFVFGLLVFLANRRRPPNQQFLVATVIIGVWLIVVRGVFTTRNVASAEAFLRWAQTLSLFIPAAMDGLRIAIVRSRNPWRMIAQNLALWCVATLPVAFLCHTRFFMSGAVLESAGNGYSIPRPLYGRGVFVWQTYYLGAWLYLAIRYTKDIRSTTGLQCTELQFPLLGFSLGALFGSFFGSILPALTSQGTLYTPLTPLCAVVMDGVIAYGIATRRILSVAHILRRTTAYALMAGYLAVLYLCSWWLVDRAAGLVLHSGSVVPHLVAALAVAFSVAPLHGRMQTVANRLFGSVSDIDVPRSLQKVLLSIGTVEQLVERFAGVIIEASGTEHLALFLEQKGTLHHVPYRKDADTCTTHELPGDDILVQTLKQTQKPVSIDTLRRRSAGTTRAALVQRMTETETSLAAGIYSKGNLIGALLLGRRRSGRIYGANEQDALQLLCGQFALALENAKLYTQAENSRIYNDILVENLVSGVVATTPEGVITVFNREAQRITRLRAAETVGQGIGVLPPVLATAAGEVLEGRRQHHEAEVDLTWPDGPPTPVRLGSTAFRDLKGSRLGVLLVFQDMTAEKALQQQVRRSDRLASMGTLSAGMAHEIKNPLVTIKTFSQLLPERFGDADFRKSFTELVGNEVKRIDGIVSQLLAFARPSKPSMTRTCVHDVLDSALRLLEQEFRRENITVTTKFEAPGGLILGDANLLNQAFVNFFLNAHDAMQEGGRLVVSTCAADTTNGGHESRRVAAGRRLCIAIEDTGGGIRQENLSQIFDPFFTTKSQGTGLGLAVAHGIIEEQGGTIEVKSTSGAGTTFLIAFPLIEEGTRS